MKKQPGASTGFWVAGASKGRSNAGKRFEVIMSGSLNNPMRIKLFCQRGFCQWTYRFVLVLLFLDGTIPFPIGKRGRKRIVDDVQTRGRCSAFRTAAGHFPRPLNLESAIHFKRELSRHWYARQKSMLREKKRKRKGVSALLRRKNINFELGSVSLDPADREWLGSFRKWKTPATRLLGRVSFVSVVFPLDGRTLGKVWNRLKLFFLLLFTIYYLLLLFLSLNLSINASLFKNDDKK